MTAIHKLSPVSYISNMLTVAYEAILTYSILHIKSHDQESFLSIQ